MVAGTEPSQAEVDRIFHALADATRRDILARSIEHEQSVSALRLPMVDELLPETVRPGPENNGPSCSAVEALTRQAPFTNHLPHMSQGSIESAHLVSVQSPGGFPQEAR